MLVMECTGGRILEFAQTLVAFSGPHFSVVALAL